MKKLFPVACPVIGMVHLKALPGTPKYRSSVKTIIEEALKEARILKEAGIDGIMIENMHDVPYVKNEVGHEISTLMGIVGYEIKKTVKIPCGIQILSSANLAALAAAKCAGLDFIRAEGFVYGHLADEGYIDACAGDLLRYRKTIDAEDILIFSDIKKKHSSHAITSDTGIAETAKTAEFFLSDGLIVTGNATGDPANPEDLEAIKKACSIPVFIGSGVTIDNLDQYFGICDGMIVGSHFKESGHWANALDARKIKSFMKNVNKLRIRKF